MKMPLTLARAGIPWQWRIATINKPAGNGTLSSALYKVDGVSNA